MLLNEVHSNYYKRVCLFLCTFCAFLLEHSLTSHVTFSRFRSSFLSNLYCSHSEVKPVANINWLQHIKKKVLMAQWEVLGVTVREVIGSNPGGERFFAPMKKN